MDSKKSVSLPASITHTSSAPTQAQGSPPEQLPSRTNSCKGPLLERPVAPLPELTPSRAKSKASLERPEQTPKARRGVTEPTMVERTKTEVTILNPQYFEEYTPAVRWCYTAAKVLKDENPKWLPYGDEENEYFEMMYRLQKGGVVLEMDNGRVVNIKKRMDTKPRKKKPGSKDYKMIRGTWFFESDKRVFTPYNEKISIKLETEFSTGSYVTKVQVSSNPDRYVEIFQNSFKQFRYSTKADRNGRSVLRGYEGLLVPLTQLFKEIKLFPEPLIQTKYIESPSPSSSRNRINRLLTLKSTQTPSEIERDKSNTEIIKKLQEECAKYRIEIKELKEKLLLHEERNVKQQEEIEILKEGLEKEANVSFAQELELTEKEKMIEKLLERLKNLTKQEVVVLPGEVNYSEYYEERSALKELAEGITEKNKADIISAITDTYSEISVDELKHMFQDILDQ